MTFTLISALMRAEQSPPKPARDVASSAPKRAPLTPAQLEGTPADALAIGPTNAFCARPNDPLVCAHGTVGSRDWPDVAPRDGAPHDVDAAVKSKNVRPLPNTVPALAAAVDAGFECVEVDVSRTKDGHLVALHSRELRHLTNGAKTSVAEITLREAMALEMPSGSYGVATFAEAMATVVNRGLRQITVDFKEDGRPGHAVSFAQTALAEIAMVDPDNGCPECVYWGKDDSVMLDVLREFPEARVGYTVANFSAAMRDGGLDNHADARARPIIARAYCAAVQSEMASHKLRRECVRAGVSKVYAWTINDAAKVRRVANEGVDAIVTDEPGEATRQIRALRDGCPRPESTKSGRAAERHNRS